MLRTWISTARLRPLTGRALATAAAWAIALVLGLAHCSICTAQTAAEVTTARNLAREGLQALMNQDFDTSADRFGRAARLVDAPTLRLGLARARVGQGRLVEAYELYQVISRENPGPKAPGAFLRAIESARTEGAELEARLSWITIRVRGQDEGELPKVRLNDAPVSAASLGVRRPVDPGTVRVVAELDGYHSSDETLTIPEGEPNVEVVLKLVPLPKPPVSPSRHPLRPPSVDGSGKAQDATDSGLPVRWISYGLMGAGGATLVGAGVVGALATSDYLKLQKSCGDAAVDAQGRHLCDGPVPRYESRQKTSLILGVAGGAVAGAGIALYFLFAEEDDDGSDVGSASVQPLLGLGSLGLQGRF